MFQIMSLALIARLPAGSVPCSEKETLADPDNWHLSDVCANYLENGGVTPTYSATFLASLNPQPASQQVLIFRRDDQWHMRVAGYLWRPGRSLVEHRRNEFAISDADANALAALMDDASLERLAAQPYYGSGDIICVDGARFQLDRAERGQRFSAAQHSCAGSTQINEIFASFRAVAVKYDAGFDGFLRGFKTKTVAAAP